MNQQSGESILSQIITTPVLDVHTHIDASHLSARGLHDILLYHMVISDLFSAGCPSGNRLPEEPATKEIEVRLKEAIQYLPYIQNTSSYWGLRIILEELYDWFDPITTQNWQKLDQRIRDRAANPDWPNQILRLARIQRVVTEYWRGRDGIADDILEYSLEWAFFARTQWGQNDIPLYELEKAWNENTPSSPLPVTLGEKSKFSKQIYSVEDIHSAIAHYCSLIPYDNILSTAQHLSTDINFRPVSQAEIASALPRRDVATRQERDIYSSYILNTFLTALEEKGEEIVFQFSFGAEPLPYETGSFLRTKSLFALATILSSHPGLQFQVFLSSAHSNQSICTLARELPNLSVSGYWWHNFFPRFIRQMISERLDMLPLNKQIGFFSDAYCVDWAYAKAKIVRMQYANVLDKKISQGQYTYEQAKQIFYQVCFATPQNLLGIKPSITLS